MFGGLLKSTSRLALVAAAATVVGGVSAQAADLGGNCCADLEERVAELEATTARKGNRKMSLTVSGQINKHIVWHDSDAVNARRSDAFSVQDNDSASQSRFRFVGSAKIDADRTAGYVLEIGISENAGVEFSRADTLSRVRQNHVFIRSATFGQLSVGQLSQATDGVMDITLANIRQMNQGGVADSARLIGGNIANVFPATQGARVQGVRYDTPTFAGFTLSASWGHSTANFDSVDNAHDTWDVALRYVGEFNGIRLAAGVGYRETENNGAFFGGATAPLAEQAVGVATKDTFWLGSASVMHTPTGLFVSGGAGQRDRDTNGVGGDFFNWHAQAGVEKNFFGIGNTTFFGEYGSTELDIEGGATGLSSGTFWGVGFVQQIAAAASDVYVGYRSYDSDNLAGLGLSDTVQVFQAGMIVRF
jgi:hypothetical protein